MTTAPRMSIGLPVYNGEDFLAESLDALLGQSYSDFELIISDNASTDGTAEICHDYAQRDARIRYFRQPRNLGLAPNHNFVVHKARGELFKLASHDDLYARDLLKRCAQALDERPDVVLAHSWSAVIDASAQVTGFITYPVATDAPRAPERFRSMLFDGWGDDLGGVVRTEVLRRTSLHGSYHFADRTFAAEIALHGPFYMVPDWLYFRREHSGQGGARRSVRARCANLDPRRARRLRHPVARLYGEYIWSYVAAIHRAPLSPADRHECYGHLARWAAGRMMPVTGRALSGRGLRTRDLASVSVASAAQSAVRVEELVAGRTADRSENRAS